MFTFENKAVILHELLMYLKYCATGLTSVITWALWRYHCNVSLLMFIIFYIVVYWGRHSLLARVVHLFVANCIHDFWTAWRLLKWLSTNASHIEALSILHKLQPALVKVKVTLSGQSLTITSESVQVRCLKVNLSFHSLNNRPILSSTVFWCILL